MSRRFLYALVVVFVAFSSLVAPVFLTAATAAAAVRGQVPPPGGIPHWVAAAGAVFFAGSLLVTIKLLRDRRRDRDLSSRGDPWPGWAHADGKTAPEAITSPDLPAVKDLEPEPVLTGVVVTDWAVAMTAPAPPIVATPTAPEVAEQWIRQELSPAAQQ
jgi:hypothetical protein